MFREVLDLFHRDNLLTQALNESYVMLEIDHEMVKESIYSLRRCETSEIKVEDIHKKDLMINEYEKEVRKKVLTHLTISGTKDLTPGLVLVSIIIDIERIGDYTKNIVELAVNHPQKLGGSIFEQELSDAEKQIIEMFSLLISALKNSDSDLSRKIMEDASLVTRNTDKWVLMLVKGEGTPENPADAVCLALYLRYLKRICAHLRNIATSIVNPFHRIGYREKK